MGNRNLVDLKNYQFPQEVKTIFKIFGNKIRLVGGSARDLLLGKKVNDFDFATEFLPEEVIKILTSHQIRSILVGFEFGTVIAVINHKNFEITTLRKDVECDGRRADVEFITDYFFDASRRDFTINALYLDQENNLYDYFGGCDDLKNHCVKFIGDADSRIKEDFLRILRFFRFSSIHAQELDKEGLKACIKNKSNLRSLSKDRVRVEIFKALEGEEAIQFFEDLDNFKIAEEIFPDTLGINNFKKVFELELALQIKVSGHLKLWSLFCKEGLELDGFFAAFNFSNKEKKYFRFLLDNFLLYKSELTIQEIRKMLVFAEKELVYDFYLLNSIKHFCFAKIPDIKNNLNFIEKFILPVFPLRAVDLMALGFEGKKLGKSLKIARQTWANHNFSLGKRDLIDFIKNNNGNFWARTDI